MPLIILILIFIIIGDFRVFAGNSIELFEGGSLQFALPLPSALPGYDNIEAEFQEASLGETIPVRVVACKKQIETCVPCPNCSIDLYYDIEGRRELYQKDIAFEENGQTLLEIKTIPTWLHVTVKGTGAGFLRIPKITFWQWVWHHLTSLDNVVRSILQWIPILYGAYLVRGKVKYFLRKRLRSLKKHLNN